ncbi:hypothetical protein [Brevibacillus sp. H7]|uniref:hypothetical protein n=1 Tax=Brevibacillus sp. H7 TaxID=3349138 RepID=UPI0037FF0075
MSKPRFATYQPHEECLDISMPDQPDLSNLQECVEEVKIAALEKSSGPEDPTDFHLLRGRLEAARAKLPPLYREAVYQPYVQKLDELGEEGFQQILRRDPGRQGMALLMLDIAQAILQNGEGYEDRATDGYQEVVSDLYDGFLSAEDRWGVKRPDKSGIPPLVKWGYPDYGPYTWTIEATEVFGLQTAIVNLPPAHAKHGLLAWAALGHETTGHDILHADTGLIQELAKNVRAALTEQNAKYGLPDYWASRIDETASDILGILNMGPAAGIGLIGYFRGLRAAYSGSPTLSNVGPEDAPHPADILRGYLAAATVRLLEFDGADVWADLIEAETDKDLSVIRLGRKIVTPEEARRSASIVASVVVHAKMQSLDNHALGEIQNWCNQDESIVAQLRALLSSEGPLSTDDYTRGFYAAHVVAAAVVEAVSKGARIPVIFERMLAVLKSMHDANPSWGPLYVVHPGNLLPDTVYSKIG